MEGEQAEARKRVAAQSIIATGLVSSARLGEPSAELQAMMADSEVRLFTPYQSIR
jgi:hypothetical protein